jgi:hypothetical protein
MIWTLMKYGSNLRSGLSCSGYEPFWKCACVRVRVCVCVWILIVVGFVTCCVLAFAFRA